MQLGCSYWLRLHLKPKRESDQPMNSTERMTAESLLTAAWIVEIESKSIDDPAAEEAATRFRRKIEEVCKRLGVDVSKVVARVLAEHQFDYSNKIHFSV